MMTTPLVEAGLLAMPLGGDYWQDAEYPLGAGYTARAGEYLTAPFELSSPVLTRRVAVDPFTSVELGTYVLTPEYDPGTGAVTAPGAYDPNQLPENNTGEPQPDGQVVVRAYGGRYRSGPANPYLLTGPVTWQQISFVLPPQLTSAAMLHIRVAGDGVAYLARLELATDEPKGVLHPDELPVWGFADLHSHPMASHAFGGHLISGGDLPATSTDPRDLGSCEAEHSRGVGDAVVNNWPDGHQAGGRRGAPDFGTWPTFLEGIHAQMHPAWIRRAFDGGLRLMVALVVNNKLLADQRHRDGDRRADDAGAIVDQITYMREVAAANGDWMEIVTSPQQARFAIHAGKLAVVLGIEVDAFLGSWIDPDELAAGRTVPEITAEIRRRVVELRDEWGVTQLNPVHLTNNAFGSTAIYDDAFNVANFHAHSHRQIFAVRPYPGDPAAGDEAIDFRLGEGGNPIAEIAAVFAEGMPLPGPLYGPEFPGQGHANVLEPPLPVAVLALQVLMQEGMVIDVDHMSEFTTDFVLTRCAAPGGPRGTYPVVSAHMNFRELAPRRRGGDEGNAGPGQRRHHSVWPHESMKSRRTANRTLDVGGMFAPITSARDALPVPGSRVPNDSPGSVKSFAQQFHLATSLSAPHGRGVGVGTDMSLNPLLGPRFGPLACYGLVEEGGSWAVAMERHQRAWRQQNAVVYTVGAVGRPRFFKPPNVDGTTLTSDGARAASPVVGSVVTLQR